MGDCAASGGTVVKQLDEYSVHSRKILVLSEKIVPGF